MVTLYYKMLYMDLYTKKKRENKYTHIRVSMHLKNRVKEIAEIEGRTMEGMTRLMLEEQIEMWKLRHKNN